MNNKTFQAKSIAINGDYSLVIGFAVVLFMITFVPLLQNQIVTGTIVNALLAISVFLFGLNGAFLLVFIPSMISLFLGVLPLAMLPMIPFIFLGNIIFILAINIFKERYWIAGIIGSFAKAAFLFASSYILFSYFAGGVGVKLLSSMMGYLQLLTASMGVILAYGVLKIFKKI